MKPDFSSYSLALVHDDEIVFSSDKKGLRPIIECAMRFSDDRREFILFDKVMGLAAARIAMRMGSIKEIHAGLCSAHAMELIKKNDIVIMADENCDMILNNDRTDVCPMEKRAIESDDNDVFFEQIKQIFRY